MTRKELLDLIVSWENLPLLIQEIQSNPEKLKLLFELTLKSNHPKSWRAAYIVDKINDSHPQLIDQFIPQMIFSLKTETNSSKKRHYLKLISQHKFSPKHHVFLMDYCLNCFTSAGEPVSIRVHALQILFNISEQEPNLKPELLSVINHEMELHATAGIVARGRKLAGKLAKQIASS
jgi:hypothetical protein